MKISRNQAKTTIKHVYKDNTKYRSLAVTWIIAFLVSYSLISAESLTETPKHFTIFDAVGEMASGMAYVHVAIPLNITTFKDQSDILYHDQIPVTL